MVRKWKQKAVNCKQAKGCHMHSQVSQCSQDEEPRHDEIVIPPVRTFARIRALQQGNGFSGCGPTYESKPNGSLVGRFGRLYSRSPAIQGHGSLCVSVVN